MNITDEVVESFKDECGDIRFYHVFMWCLPRFQVDGETQTYFAFLAARWRNYMTHLMKHHKFVPKYFDPAEGKTIQEHHVTRFFGVQAARCQRGSPSIHNTWST